MGHSSRVTHRKNEVIPCACGCGGTLKKYGHNWIEHKYIHGHNQKGKGKICEFTCTQCGKIVQYPNGKLGKTISGLHFCSNKCSGIFSRGYDWDKEEGKRIRSDEYEKQREWSNAVKKRDKYTCQECGFKYGSKDSPLNAHHIVRWADSVELRYELDNGITLCKRCHYKVHGLKDRKCQDTPTLQLVI